MISKAWPRELTWTSSFAACGLSWQGRAKPLGRAPSRVPPPEGPDEEADRIHARRRRDRQDPVRSPALSAALFRRGGGGEIGMHCYNNYELARAIATFPLPVLTGIGHSTNLTVCEMIAFNNGITPSDLAYFLLRIFEELDEPLDTALLMLPELVKASLQQFQSAFRQTTQRFQSETKRALQQHVSEHAALAKDFSHATELALRNQRYLLQNGQQQLHSFTKQLFQTGMLQLVNNGALLGIHAKNQLQQEQRTVNQISGELPKRLTPLFQVRQTALEVLEKQLQLVDPIHVLRRGYSIVTNEKGAIGSGNVPAAGEEIRIIQADFTVIGETKSVEPHPEKTTKK